MENFETVKNFKKDIAAAAVNVPKLKTDLLILEQKQPALDMEASKAKYLEKKNWQKKLQEAEENRKAIWTLRAEIEEIEKRIGVLKEGMKDFEAAAIRDIRNFYRKPYEEAVRKFFAALKQAYELERELADLIHESRQKSHQINSIGFTIVPFLNRLLIERDGDLQEYSPFNLFVKDAKQQGVPLEG